jgi:hypothetical protein
MKILPLTGKDIVNWNIFLQVFEALLHLIHLKSCFCTHNYIELSNRCTYWIMEMLDIVFECLGCTQLVVNQYTHA